METDDTHMTMTYDMNAVQQVSVQFLSTIVQLTIFWHVLHLCFRYFISRLLPKETLEESTSISTTKRKTYKNHDNKDNDNEEEQEEQEEQEEEQVIKKMKLKMLHKLRNHSPSYLVSTVHAVFQVIRGVSHLLRLFRAPILLKLHNPYTPIFQPLFVQQSNLTQVLPMSPPLSSNSSYLFKYLFQINAVHRSNFYLISYLISDSIFVVQHYPKLGGIDVIIHHMAFLYCALIGGFFHINPFMFSWLIVGELSTPFLNLRWLLLTLMSPYRKFHQTSSSHRFMTILLNVVQFFFALFFFATRVCLYSLGLLYQIEIIQQFPSYVPKWAIYSTFSFVVVGFLLNVTWFFKIMSKFYFSPSSSSSSSKPAPVSSNLHRQKQVVKKQKHKSQ